MAWNLLLVGADVVIREQGAKDTQVRGIPEVYFGAMADTWKVSRIELRHLRYFAVVADELHFGRAARRLHMSQPPLSVQIRRLEELVGARLFDRDRSGVALTPAGVRLRAEVAEFFEHFDDMLGRVRAVAEGRAGALGVGFVTPATYGVLPECLAAFRASFPGVELILREMTTDAQVQALESGALDIGFVLPPVDRPGLLYAPVSQESLVVALPRSSPLARDAGRLALKRLAALPLVIFPRQHAPRLYDDVLTVCRRSGFSPTIGQQAVEMQTIVALVAAGMGFAVVPASVRRLGREGVVYREFRERSPLVELGLAWRRDRDSALLAQFRSVVLAQGGRG
jgi:DNA-binding transcriptional LysR family regulator